MGLVTTALQIGRSALLSYQSALEITGNNIANAARPGYVRQTPILTGIAGPIYRDGFQPGNGVAITSLLRNVDEALQARLRSAVSDQNSVLVEQQSLGQIESVLNELSDTDLSTLLNDFFGAWADLQTQPQDIPARRSVLTTGAAVANELHRQRTTLFGFVNDYNDNIEAATGRANELAGEIARLNVEIVSAGSSGGAAGALRDQRDGALEELSTLVGITTREQTSGAVNVYVGNEPLVFDGTSRGLTTDLKTVDEIQRVRVVFGDNGLPVSLNGGTIEGLVTSRDSHIAGQIAAIDKFSAALIQDVNRVHAGGQGLDWLHDVTGWAIVDDATVPLNDPATGLDAFPQNGSFLVKVRNEATGAIETTLIEVDLDGIGTDTTLESLRADLDAIDNLTATIRPDGKLELTAAAGFDFGFAEDTSGAVAALGINTFFEGTDARDIKVNATLAANPRLLAAAAEGEGLDGDGGNAGLLAALGNESSKTLNGISLFDFYETIVGNVAVMSSAAKSGVEAADVILSSLNAQRESVSGVNLDEEAVALAKYQRSFQGAARYVSVVDELISEMLSLV